jgi:hypothetical protein
VSPARLTEAFMSLLPFLRRKPKLRRSSRGRARLPGRVVDRGHAPHRREGGGLPRDPAARHAGLRRPYRRDRDRRHGRHGPSGSRGRASR